MALTNVILLCVICQTFVHQSLVFPSLLSLLVVSVCYNRILLMGEEGGGVPFSFIVLQTLVVLQLLFLSHNAAIAFTP